MLRNLPLTSLETYLFSLVLKNVKFATCLKVVRIIPSFVMFIKIVMSHEFAFDHCICSGLTTIHVLNTQLIHSMRVVKVNGQVTKVKQTRPRLILRWVTWLKLAEILSNLGKFAKCSCSAGVSKKLTCFS